MWQALPTWAGRRACGRRPATRDHPLGDGKTVFHVAMTFMDQLLCFSHDHPTRTPNQYVPCTQHPTQNSFIIHSLQSTQVHTSLIALRIHYKMIIIYLSNIKWRAICSCSVLDPLRQHHNQDELT